MYENELPEDDAGDLLDREYALLDAITAGVSDRDRPSLVRELAHVRALLDSLGGDAATG